MTKKIILILVLIVLGWYVVANFVVQPRSLGEIDRTLQSYTVSELNRENFPILPGENIIKINTKGFVAYKFYTGCDVWESEDPCPTSSIILSTVRRLYPLRPEELRADEVRIDISDLTEAEAQMLEYGEEYEVTIAVGKENFEIDNFQVVR